MNFALRRPSRRRIAAAIVVVLIACVLANLFVSSAAQLNLGSVARPHLDAMNRCDADGVALTTPATSGTTTRVDVSGINAACAGLPIVVRVATGASSSSSTTSVNVPAGGGSMTLNTASPAFDPDNVVQTSVTIGTWPMSGTWSYTPPVTLPAASCRIPSNPSIPCTATISGNTQWADPITHWQRYITVATAHSTNVVWEVTINLSSTEFPVFANRLQDLQGGVVLVGTPSCSANPRTVTVRGVTTWGDHHQVRAGKTSMIQIEGSTTGTGNLLTCP